MKNKIDGCIGRSSGEYDKQLHVISDDSLNVVLRLVDDTHRERFDKGIYIPESIELNNRLSEYIIMDCSIACTNDYGLVVNDIVLADRLSCHYDTYPIQVMSYDNIICKVIDGIPTPLSDMIFVEQLLEKDKTSKGIILSQNVASELPIGEVTRSTVDKYPIGEIIVLTTGADNVTIDGNKFMIYKGDMVTATIEMTDDDRLIYE